MTAPTPDASPVPVQQAHPLPAPEQLQQMHQVQQMQQVSAMMAMAAASAGTAPDLGGLCGVMTSPAGGSLPGIGAPGMAPGYSPFDLDQVAFASMFAQMLQAQGGACGACDPGALSAAGMPVQPPAPAMFPPLVPSLAAATVPPTPTVSVSVEGMKYQYQLTEDDLQKVFSRYGAVAKIAVDEAGTSALITFQEFHNAQSAMADLHGKVLNGLE
ncbi:unnamed protein product, partial [Prorocentrum cordatum]